MPDNRSVPAVLYAAKSTEDKHASIPDQLARNRALAERENWRVAGEFSDEGFSAYSRNRGPDLEKAKALATELAEREGECFLVALHSDRVARGAGDAPNAADHLVEVVATLRRHSVRLRTVEDDFFADDRIGLLMAAVMGQRNSEDSKRKSESVRAGMDRSRKRGVYVGGSAYGLAWRRDENDERIPYFRPEAVPIIRRIFSEYLGGAAQLTIAQRLNAEGIPTARSGKWHQASVRSLLAAPVYAGLVHDGDRLIEGKHEGVIDRETWEKVQQLRQSKARTSGPGRPVVGLHIFRKGLLRCGVCGGSMVPRTTPNRTPGSVTERYYCYGRTRDPRTCSMQPVPRVEVDLAVLSYFEQVGLDLEATRNQLTAAVTRKSKEVQALLSNARKEAQEAASSLTRIKRDYAKGDISAAEWRELREELDPERDAAEAAVSRLETQLADAASPWEASEEELIEQLAEIRRAVAGEVNDAESVAAVRSALTRLFDGFILHADVPDEAHVELIGERWIEPIVASRTVEGYEEMLQPALKPEPHTDAENNYAEGLVR